MPRNEKFNRVERDQKARLIGWSNTFICDINAPDAPVRSKEARFAEQMRFAEHLDEI